MEGSRKGGWCDGMVSFRNKPQIMWGERKYGWCGEMFSRMSQLIRETGRVDDVGRWYHLGVYYSDCGGR